MTQATELRKMNDDELAAHLAESKEEMFTLRFQLAMGKQDNSARLGDVSREVARVLTLQREREIADAAAAGPAAGSTRPKRSGPAKTKRRKGAR
jgi:large subunit ribosomal protein L29